MEKLAVKFKALADKNRLTILELLRKKNYCVRALAEKLEMSESAVSQHLKKLRKAGLVVGEKKGYWVHYTVQSDQLTVLADELTSLAESNGQNNNSCCQQ